MLRAITDGLAADSPNNDHERICHAGQQDLDIQDHRSMYTAKPIFYSICLHSTLGDILPESKGTFLRLRLGAGNLKSRVGRRLHTARMIFASIVDFIAAMSHNRDYNSSCCIRTVLTGSGACQPGLCSLLSKVCRMQRLPLDRWTVEISQSRISG